MEKRVLIIGGGPAGIFTSWACGMYQMKSIIIDSMNKLGGQCSELYPHKVIYDIPAIKETTGQGLIDSLIDQAKVFDPEIILNAKVISIKKENDIFNVIYHDLMNNIKHNIKVDGIIIAAGRGAFDFKKAEFMDADICENKNLFYHVTTPDDFQNQIIAINGGGDSAADYAQQLSYIAKKIYLIHRRNSFRFSDNMLDKLQKNEKIEIITSAYISQVQHEEGFIQKIYLSNQRELDIDCLLCFYGLNPDLKDILQWNLTMLNNKILVNSDYSTNIEGIYAISDIATKEDDIEKKLILHAFSEGYTAAYNISKYLKLNTRVHYSTSSILAKK